MAQKVQVMLVDDLDGGEAEETVTFALDGKVYEIDLSGPNAQNLRNTLEPWRARARRAGTNNLRAKGVTSSRYSRPQLTKVDDDSKVRDWARRHSLPINERGRVPSQIREAYEAAQRGDDGRLKGLLTTHGLDPNAKPAPEKTIFETTEAPKALTAEDRARITAQQAGKLSKAQLIRLRKANADKHGLGISDGRSEATSYEALVKRGLMRATADEDIYEICLAGRLWFEVHGISPNT